MLSGASRNRLLLARLFARPAKCWCSTNRPTISISNRLELLRGHASRTMPGPFAAREPRPGIPRQRRDPDTRPEGRRPLAGIRRVVTAMACATLRVALRLRRQSGGAAMSEPRPSPAVRLKMSFKEVRELEELAARNRGARTGTACVDGAHEPSPTTSAGEIRCRALKADRARPREIERLLAEKIRALASASMPRPSLARA